MNAEVLTVGTGTGVRGKVATGLGVEACVAVVVETAAGERVAADDSVAGDAAGETVTTTAVGSGIVASGAVVATGPALASADGDALSCAAGCAVPAQAVESRTAVAKSRSDLTNR